MEGLTDGWNGRTGGGRDRAGSGPATLDFLGRTGGVEPPGTPGFGPFLRPQSLLPPSLLSGCTASSSQPRGGRTLQQWGHWGALPVCWEHPLGGLVRLG